MDTLELLQRVRASALNQSTVDALNITVEQLCCDYAHGDAQELVNTGKQWLARVTELLENRLTLSQHRDILNNAGMLALLVGCLEYDLGETAAAEAPGGWRSALGRFGEPAIVGWAHEMLAWFHLTAGNHRAVISAAETGIVAAPSNLSRSNSMANKPRLMPGWAGRKTYMPRWSVAANCWIACPIRNGRTTTS